MSNGQTTSEDLAEFFRRKAEARKKKGERPSANGKASPNGKAQLPSILAVAPKEAKGAEARVQEPTELQPTARPEPVKDRALRTRLLLREIEGPPEGETFVQKAQREREERGRRRIPRPEAPPAVPEVTRAIAKKFSELTRE